MALLTASHSRYILEPNYQVCGCNCRVRNNCPLHNKCLTPEMVYQATATNNKVDVENMYDHLWKLLARKGTGITSIILDIRKMVLGKKALGKNAPGNKPSRKIAPGKIVPWKIASPLPPLLLLKNVFCKASSCYGIS